MALSKLNKKTAERVAHALMDFTWASPLSTFVQAADLASVLDDMEAAPPVPEGWQDWLEDTMHRLPPEHGIWSETFESLAHPTLYSIVESQIMAGGRLDEDLVAELMKVELVSIILRRLVEKILEAFVEGVLNKDKSRVAGVGRTAFGFAARASKGLFEKVSAQIEGPLRQTMKGFVQGSMDRVKVQLANILKSDEVSEQLGDAKQTLFRFHARKTLSDWRSYTSDESDMEGFVHSLRDTVIHLSTKESVRKVIETEFEHLLKTYGPQPLSALVPEEVQSHIDAELRPRIVARWTKFFQSKSFSEALKG